MEYLSRAKQFVISFKLFNTLEDAGQLLPFSYYPPPFFLLVKLDLFRYVLLWSTFQAMNKASAMVS